MIIDTTVFKLFIQYFSSLAISLESSVSTERMQFQFPEVQSAYILLNIDANDLKIFLAQSIHKLIVKSTREKRKRNQYSAVEACPHLSSTENCLIF